MLAPTLTPSAAGHAVQPGRSAEQSLAIAITTTIITAPRGGSG